MSARAAVAALLDRLGGTVGHFDWTGPGAVRFGAPPVSAPGLPVQAFLESVTWSPRPGGLNGQILGDLVLLLIVWVRGASTESDTPGDRSLNALRALTDIRRTVYGQRILGGHATRDLALTVSAVDGVAGLAGTAGFAARLTVQTDEVFGKPPAGFTLPAPDPAEALEASMLLQLREVLRQIGTAFPADFDLGDDPSKVRLGPVRRVPGLAAQLLILPMAEAATGGPAFNGMTTQLRVQLLGWVLAASTVEDTPTGRADRALALLEAVKAAVYGWQVEPHCLWDEVALSVSAFDGMTPPAAGGLRAELVLTAREDDVLEAA